MKQSNDLLKPVCFYCPHYAEVQFATGLECLICGAKFHFDAEQNAHTESGEMCTHSIFGIGHVIVADISIIRELSKALSVTFANYTQDIEQINNMLNAEADRRNFCEEYEEFIIELNKSLNRELTPRIRSYNLEVEVEYHVRDIVKIAFEAPTFEKAQALANEYFELIELDDMQAGDPRFSKFDSIEDIEVIDVKEASY